MEKILGFIVTLSATVFINTIVRIVLEELGLSDWLNGSICGMISLLIWMKYFELI
jgi:hypothetical protein